MTKKLIRLVLVLVGAVVLASCGGGGDDTPVVVASAEAVAPMNTEVAAAVQSEAFEFNAVPDLGTTVTTTIAFTGTTTSATGTGTGGSATNPGFSISSGGFTASGETTFGSCIFLIKASTFPAGHALSLGSQIRIDPCTLSIILQNMPANSQPLSRAATLKLALAISRGRPINVSVTSTGQVLIGGRVIATVPVARVSGT
ncbi:hypothetical protein FN976_06165 [Caenimonas sedimenti]|uniref:DUF5666 domain-containing protein n=1 Tax=Caenimonas sedimenti TaxID=2596921 RepID=A0A562ZV75_9BURK|nr:hypothetical protein [Caenimonas sedimenti]TWO72287.1 hypothetical protein FN976_06165 [Caenimonas sedimenti]